MPGKHCSIFGCIKKHSKGGDTSFHAFPKDPDIRSQWILATRRQNWNPPKSAWVCSDHFNKNDFVEMFPGQVRKKLKKGAIPSHMKRSHVAQERASKSEFIDCNMSLDIAKELQSHFETVHNSLIQHEGDMDIDALNLPMPQTLHECSQCVAAYDSETDLKQHMTIAHETQEVSYEVEKVLGVNLDNIIEEEYVYIK